MEKEIIPIDEGNFAGEILYGYTNLKEAKKDYEKLTGEKLDMDLIQYVRVIKKIDENGDDYYFWGEKCKTCGRKNDGVLSMLHGE